MRIKIYCEGGQDVQERMDKMAEAIRRYSGLEAVRVTGGELKTVFDRFPMIATEYYIEAKTPDNLKDVFERADQTAPR